MTNSGPGSAERVALSQELSEFLIEFSIALHRAAMYPWGHPSLERGAAMVVSRLAALLLDRPSISIGVARTQLVIEGVATDSRHPVLRSMAEKLHRHHLGAVSFERGVSADDVVQLMRLVGAEPEKGATPLGLGDTAVLTQWKHARLYPLTYEQLELLEQSPAEDDELRERGTRSAQLWLGLARAALTGKDEKLDPESTEPAAVARAINQHPAAKAYDQVIVGYLLQLAQELKLEGGTTSLAVRKRLSRLIGALDGSTLQRLIEMGGDSAQRQRFVLDATEALTADAVIEIVQAAAASNNQDISHSMIRLLSKLSAFAEKGSQLLQIQADHALREQVRQLLEGWTLEDANPDEYTRALISLARREVTLAATAKTRYLPEPLRIVQTALEVEVTGVPLWRAVAEVIEQQGVTPLVAALRDVRPENKAGTALWQHLASPESVRSILGRDAVDFSALSPVLDRMDQRELAPLLLDVLIESGTRDTREGVFQRLTEIDLEVLEPYIARHLRDERWFVSRNMLALLNQKRAFSSAVSLAQYARHTDVRIRREAVEVWMRSPHERDRAICVALADQDERILRAAVAEAQQRCPDAAVPLVARRVREALPVDLRAQLIQLLAGQRHPLALEALVRSASSGRNFLGRLKLAAKSPESLAALSVLAQTWPGEARVATLLGRARKAKDPEIRAAVEAGSA